VTAATVAIVVAGFVAVGVAAATGGVDIAAAVILVLIAALGALAVVVARKARAGEVKPATCRACGGLNSPNAPTCKHCGAALP
jgi:ribosomal protein L40E